MIFGQNAWKMGNGPIQKRILRFFGQIWDVDKVSEKSAIHLLKLGGEGGRVNPILKRSKIS